MRYFVRLAYRGTNYNGWQVQPNAPSVQAVIEKAFSTILNTPIDVVGCGRTDTGVHAESYTLHFEYDKEFPKHFLSRMNKFLPKDIVIYDIYEVAEDMHARFSATERSYVYHINCVKNPFRQDIAWHYPFAQKLDKTAMTKAANLLLEYKEFTPFCKTNSDAKTMLCDMRRAEWIFVEEENRMEFHVTANRFLRGMIRLIVGMSVNVGLGKLSVEDVKRALDTQTLLKKSYSVPPQGLFLRGIKYE